FLNHCRSFFRFADSSRPGHSSSLPWGGVGKQALEAGDLSGHVGAGVVLGQESRQAFLEKALPRLVFKTGVDRVEEDPVRFGGLKVTRGVADYQDLVRFVAAHRAESQMLPLAAEFLAGDNTLSGNFMRPLRYIEDCRRS